RVKDVSRWNTRTLEAEDPVQTLELRNRPSGSHGKIDPWYSLHKISRQNIAASELRREGMSTVYLGTRDLSYLCKTRIQFYDFCIRGNDFLGGGTGSQEEYTSDNLTSSSFEQTSKKTSISSRFMPRAAHFLSFQSRETGHCLPKWYIGFFVVPDVESYINK
ncbi:hypothetical protein BGX26_004385, partial [Mortierella sp. AD094]